MLPSQLTRQTVLTSASVEDGGAKKALWRLIHRPGGDTGHGVNTKLVWVLQMRSMTCSSPWRQYEVLDHNSIKAESHWVGIPATGLWRNLPREHIWVPGFLLTCLLLSSEHVCTPHFLSPSLSSDDIQALTWLSWDGVWHLASEPCWCGCVLLCKLHLLSAHCTCPHALCARNTYPWSCFVPFGCHHLGSNIQVIAKYFQCLVSNSIWPGSLVPFSGNIVGDPQIFHRNKQKFWKGWWPFSSYPVSFCSRKMHNSASLTLRYGQGLHEI